MNITFLFTYGYSLETWQTAGTIKKELKILNYLSNKFNLNFTLVTYGNDNDVDIARKYCNFKVIPIYSFISKSEYKVVNYIKSFFIPFKISKKLKNQDIIHQHQLLGSWIAIILKTILKIPLLIRTGYDMYLFSLHENKSFYIQYLYKLLTKLSFRLSNIYTITSNSDAIFLKENLNIDSNKLRIRPNFIEENKSKLFDQRESNKILSVGRLEDQKNYLFLINSLRNLSNWQVDIVGSGSQKRALEKIADEVELKVNFVGNLKYEELERLYQNYKFYISTSKFEGNPKTVLEAMSFGCVPIVSNISNHTEIVKHNFNGFVFDLNESSIIKIFENEIVSLDNLETISQNVSKSLINTNSLEKIANLVHQDYLEIFNT